MMFEQTKALCQSFLDMGVPFFDLAVYQNGECIFRHMDGYTDLENKIAVKGNEKYNIYSCSKLITCAAALQLWEKGKFSLEDKLSDYLPEFKEMTIRTEEGLKKAEKPILIKHLFEMTAGFTYEVYSPKLQAFYEASGGKCPTRECMVHLAKEPLLFEPGEKWNYSLCHDILAVLVEVIAGESFEDYVQKNIFIPLGMKDSTFLLPLEQRDILAEQYRFDHETGKAVNCGKGNWYRPGSDYASGGAGCVSTMEDYMKFLEALRVGDTILKKETIAMMATDRLTESQRATYNKKENYGYGLGVRTPMEGGKFFDFGWGGAAGSYLSIDPARNLTLFYIQHLLESPNQDRRPRVYECVINDLEGKELYPEWETVETLSGVTY